ncbi:hypothetical protein O181_115271 [Austropuccinia psidii MF-1]|uniref:Uncharacterized protein n=1 Tax=Austropuccinia psidii MF-1 TaxID=1389203 RepID=A0A9Q3PW24_9BASI|nr:hypothetical protein [Austropuccinia psidii MF-1]
MRNLFLRAIPSALDIFFLLQIFYLLKHISRYTSNIIDRIIADFGPHRSTGKKAPPEGFNEHAGVHMFFVDALDDQLVNRLTHSPPAPYLRQLLELFTTNTLPKEPLKQSLDENAYDISRLQPFVKLILEEALSNELDLHWFPDMGKTPTLSGAKTGDASLATNGGGPTSLRSAKPSWQRPKSKTVFENQQRVMVFVDGGLTHSEIRAAYEVSEAHSKDTVIGSTHIYTPKKYIADLVNIDRGGASQSMGLTTVDANSLRPLKLNK